MKPAYFKETLPRDLIQALREYPKGRDCQRVYDDVLRARNGRGERTLENFKSRNSFESAVRATFNQYNRDGSVWRKNGADPKNALFFCPHGLGMGVWAVDLERAEAWLAESPYKGQIKLAGEPSDVTF
jgi:hypothetical protein